MNFTQKIGEFVRNFFKNISADPVSTMKGFAQIAGGCSAIYGMVTGSVEVNSLSVGAACALIASGIHALGTNVLNNVDTRSIENVVNTVAVVAPTIVEQVAAMKADAEAGQKKIDAFQAVSNALNEVVAKLPENNTTEIK
jgi:ABC-type uncharacterized transport system permease subunit